MIVIHVQGGNVVNVYSDNPNEQVKIIDFDNVEDAVEADDFDNEKTQLEQQLEDAQKTLHAVA